MSVLVNCPSCQGAVQVPEEWSGRQVECPKCQTTFQAVLPLHLAGNDQTGVATFRVHQVRLAALLPLARYYNCFHCQHELTDWVMKQAPTKPSACPNCGFRIDEKDIAQAQRDTKLGCWWTLVGVALVLLVPAAIFGFVVLWAQRHGK